MAVSLAFSTMTQQGYIAMPGQVLEQTQSEFLPVVFDRFVSLINSPAFEKFLAVTTAELAPPDSACLDVSQ